MITPSFALTATERVLPNMALDFTTAALDPRVTFTRSGNTATVTNSSGVIAAINADLPRFDFDPTTLVCNGLLIEETRTNLLLNSLLNGTNLATQLVTTTAVAHTLTFYGTGQIVLTGTSSATVVGAGAYPARQTLTFTPIAGVLTLTVTGTVQYAQLEVGGFATSFIPTAATAVTRNADVATMTGANFSDWYNQAEGTVAVSTTTKQITKEWDYVNFTQTSPSNNRIRLYCPVTVNATQITAATTSYFVIAGAPVLGNIIVATGYKVSNSNMTQNKINGADNTSVVAPTSIDKLFIGCFVDNVNAINGWVKKIQYYPYRLTNAQLASIT